MDINNLESVNEDTPIFVHFKDSRTKELMYDGERPVGAKVCGTYSQRYRDASKELRDRSAKAARRGAKFDGDMIEGNQFFLEAACIAEWTFTAGGQPFPISADNWRRIVKAQPHWEEQVAEQMQDHESFSAGN